MERVLASVLAGGASVYIGYGDNMTRNQEEPQNLNAGITLVGKGARIPNGVKIGHNRRIKYWTEQGDFNSDFVPSGGSIKGKMPRRYVI